MKLLTAALLTLLSSTVLAESCFGPGGTAALLTLLSSTVLAESCFGPGGCACPEGQVWDNCQHTSPGPGPCIPGCIAAPSPVGPTGPAQLCIAESCAPVTYSWSGDFAVAQSSLGNGYQAAGIIGPCLYADRWQCPDIFNQAFDDMRLKALQYHRAQRY